MSILPADLVLGNANFRPEMVGYDPPCGTYIHIAGTDIIRDPKGDFYVLEDNARTPSGVSTRHCDEAVATWRTLRSSSRWNGSLG